MALGGAPPLARAAVVKFPAAAAAAKFTCRHLASYSTALFRSLLVPVGSRTPWAGCGLGACNRGFASDDSFPKALERDLKDTMNIPVGGENLYRRVGGPGYPMLFDVKYDRPTWQPLWEDEHEVIPRDGYGVPAHIPPEVSTKIKHVFHVPPQFYPFLKKLGDDTPALRPYMEKLIKGELTFEDYEDMFYRFAKPAKIYRRQIPEPYRTPEEIEREQEVAWEGAWLSYRQRVLSDYQSSMYLREYLFGALVGVFFGYLWLDQHRQYRIDMKLFYLEAPENKVNWVKPRGDLV
ncbi:Chromosome II, complete genome, related [Eimeria necatrix]|uniref:Chromosome II, complete genome, related n=1 Tax=Eimeria necatrix TaxID=51315 RepID=U6MFS5_9EIME|nr:Chromosome II, complete genome, related [Eimeria necatrix]CDJ62886.1 Chromosome II, complete genome, related [Eimeria necatrix]